MAIAKPDYHFLYVGPGLGVDWVFGAAGRYIQAFRPIVTDNLTVIETVPARRRVAITSMTRRDTADRIAKEIAKRYPKATHDALVYDFHEEMRIALDGRAEIGQRLGVPEG